MEYYAGIDVSLKESSVCIVDAKGKIVREVKVASEPETLVRYFDELELPVCRIGLEAGPLSHWLHAGLVAAGRDVVSLDAVMGRRLKTSQVGWLSLRMMVLETESE